MSTTSCKHCDSADWQVRVVTRNYRQQLFIVECGDCKYDMIPVVVDLCTPTEQVMQKCEVAWNKSNNDS